jgi:heme exporter protein C
MNRKLDLAAALLWVVTTPLMFVAIWMVFKYAPEERVMGAAQKIFYFHVPSAIMTFLAVFILLGSSVAYLRTRNLAWDNLSKASTEVAVLLCTLVLTTGPVWAKSAWGVWWTWEAKLTTTLVLWLLLIASLMVRNYSSNRDQAARLGAIVAIVAAVDVPIIHRATVWWRGQHPVVFAPNKGGALAPPMLQTFQVCMLTFFLLLLLLILLRYRVASLEDRTHAAFDRLAFRRGD